MSVAAVVVWGRLVFVGAHGQAAVAWPIVGQGRPDLAVVDTVARLQLAARRIGGSIQVRDATPDLVELFELVGLGRELLGEPERPEQVGIQEGVQGGDPVA
jgi:hypothetical protein